MKTRITQSDPMYCLDCDTFQSRITILHHAMHGHVTTSLKRGRELHRVVGGTLKELRNIPVLYHKAG